MAQGPRSRQETPCGHSTPLRGSPGRVGVGGIRGQHAALRCHRRGHRAARMNERCWHRPPAPPRQMASAWAHFREPAGRDGGGTRRAGAAGAARSHVPPPSPPTPPCSPAPLRADVPEPGGEAAGGPPRNAPSGVGPQRGGWARGPRARGDRGWHRGQRRRAGFGDEGGSGVPDPRPGRASGPRPLGTDPARCCHRGVRLSLPAPGCWGDPRRRALGGGGRCPHPGVLRGLPSLGTSGTLIPHPGVTSGPPPVWGAAPPSQHPEPS